MRAADLLFPPALVGMALALVQAGAGELILGRHLACLDASGYLRFAQIPPPGCLAPETLALVKALSRGLAGALISSLPPLPAWILSSLAQGFLAAFMRVTGGRWWPAVYLAAHIFLFVVASGVIYLRQYVV